MSVPTIFGRAFDEVRAPADLSNYLMAELGSPARHWHGLLHHALMLRSIARARPSAAQRRLLIWAVLFHDIVYDAKRVDNEEASTAVARTWLTGDEAEDVARMILATKHHRLDTDPMTRTLLKADLAILWTPSRPLHVFYARGIRREYAHVPDAAYRPGRAAVLDRLEAEIGPVLDGASRDSLTSNLTRERAALTDGMLDLLGLDHPADVASAIA